MSTFNVESGVPMPIKRRDYQMYPWDKMKVGDSFFVRGGVDRRHKVYQASLQFRRHHPEFAFTFRAVEGGIRIWRIEAPAPSSPA